MQILWMIAAGICLVGLIVFVLLGICAGGMLVEKDRAKQESAKTAEEPKLCFDGCSRFESEIIVARLLAADKQKRKRVY